MANSRPATGSWRWASRQTGPLLVLANGAGCTPLIQLYGYAAEVHRAPGERRLSVARTLVGNYVTSLDMAGTMVTICRLDDLSGPWSSA